MNSKSSIVFITEFVKRLWTKENKKYFLLTFMYYSSFNLVILYLFCFTSLQCSNNAGEFYLFSLEINWNSSLDKKIYLWVQLIFTRGRDLDRYIIDKMLEERFIR